MELHKLAKQNQLLARWLKDQTIEIEEKEIGTDNHPSNWNVCIPDWDFSFYEYRVKPKARCHPYTMNEVFQKIGTTIQYADDSVQTWKIFGVSPTQIFLVSTDIDTKAHSFRMSSTDSFVITYKELMNFCTCETETYFRHVESF